MFAAPSSTSIYFVTLLRHGQSLGNAAGLHQGQAEFPLSEKGIAQVRALIRRWKREEIFFDKIIASPLQRAQQTAEMIANAFKFPIELDETWMERDIGLLQGLAPEEAYKTHPRPAFIHPYQAIGQTGESQWELYIRAAQGIQNILFNPPGRYLIVSHGGILNLVMYAILGIAPQANFTGPRFRFNNTAFASLTYVPEEHKWSVLGLNDRSHLQDSDLTE